MPEAAAAECGHARFGNSHAHRRSRVTGYPARAEWPTRLNLLRPFHSSGFRTTFQYPLIPREGLGYWFSQEIFLGLIHLRGMERRAAERDRESRGWETLLVLSRWILQHDRQDCRRAHRRTCSSSPHRLFRRPRQVHQHDRQRESDDAVAKSTTTGIDVPVGAEIAYKGAEGILSPDFAPNRPR